MLFFLLCIFFFFPAFFFPQQHRPRRRLYYPLLLLNFHSSSSFSHFIRYSLFILFPHCPSYYIEYIKSMSDSVSKTIKEKLAKSFAQSEKDILPWQHCLTTTCAAAWIKCRRAKCRDGKTRRAARTALRPLLNSLREDPATIELCKRQCQQLTRTRSYRLRHRLSSGSRMKDGNHPEASLSPEEHARACYGECLAKVTAYGETYQKAFEDKWADVVTECMEKRCWEVVTACATRSCGGLVSSSPSSPSASPPEASAV